MLLFERFFYRRVLPAEIGRIEYDAFIQIERARAADADAANLVVMDWPYKVHLVLGMTIFLLFPFSRLVHVWSGFGTLAYIVRPYQLVRSRRLNLPPGHDRPRRAS